MIFSVKAVMYRVALLVYVMELVSCADNGSNQLPLNAYAKFSYVFVEGDTAKTMGVAEFSKLQKDGQKISFGADVNIFLDTSLLKLNTEVFPQYVCTQDTSNFLKPHSWVIKLDKGPKKEYTFKAKPLWFTTIIPSIVGKEDLLVRCSAISKTDHVTMMLNGNFSDSSEVKLDITPEEGKFIIPANFWKKVDTIYCRVWFTIWTNSQIEKDEFFVGGEVEIVRWTKYYDIKVVR
jgi:hypothetical protein